MLGAVPPSPVGAWAPAGRVRPGSARGARRGAGRVAGPARPRASPAPGRSWRGRSRAALGSAPRALCFTFRCAGRARPPPGAHRLPSKVGAVGRGRFLARGRAYRQAGPGRSGPTTCPRPRWGGGRAGQGARPVEGPWCQEGDLAFCVGSYSARQFQERRRCNFGWRGERPGGGFYRSGGAGWGPGWERGRGSGFVHFVKGDAGGGELGCALIH